MYLRNVGLFLADHMALYPKIALIYVPRYPTSRHEWNHSLWERIQIFHKVRHSPGTNGRQCFAENVR
jgi:hypothetical protein